MSRLRVVALCCDGPPQRYFLARLAAEHDLVGIALHAMPAAHGSFVDRLRRHANPLRLARHLMARAATARAVRATATERRVLVSIDGSEAKLPNSVPMLRTGNINAPEVVALVAGSGADVVLVNGTNLLRAPLLELAREIPLGFVNLHTGLSPYTRGGNCNLWALLEGHPEWVGVTVHQIDSGIDSGDLIATAQTPLRANDLYETIDARNFRQGFDLLLAALGPLAEGRVKPVPQWGGGRLYLRRTGYEYEPWLHVRANRMIANGLIARYLEDKEAIDREVRTVELP